MHIAEQISYRYLRRSLPSPARFGLGDTPTILTASAPRYIDPPPVGASSSAIAIVRAQLDELDAAPSTSCGPESIESDDVQSLRSLIGRVRARLLQEQSEGASDLKYYNGVRLPRVKIVFDKVAATSPESGQTASPPELSRNHTPVVTVTCGPKRKRCVSTRVWPANPFTFGPGLLLTPPTSRLRARSPARNGGDGRDGWLAAVKPTGCSSPLPQLRATRLKNSPSVLLHPRDLSSAEGE